MAAKEWWPCGGHPPQILTCFTDQTGLGYLNSIIFFFLPFFYTCYSPALTALTLLWYLFSSFFASLFFPLMFKKQEKNRQRQMKAGLNQLWKKTSCCFEVGLLSKLEWKKLQPFYLQTGSGLTVLNEVTAKMKTRGFLVFFYFNFVFWLFGPSDMEFVSVVLKYLHDHVCVHATYMDMHRLCVWIPVVFLFMGWERVHLNVFVVVSFTWRIALGDIDFSTFLITCKTFNPCCLKFTLLSTANVLALN